MTKRKKNHSASQNSDNSQDSAANRIICDNPDINMLADQYLDLWQDNIRKWSTDPDALDKWISTIKADSVKNTADK